MKITNSNCGTMMMLVIVITKLMIIGKSLILVGLAGHPDHCYQDHYYNYDYLIENCCFYYYLARCTVGRQVCKQIGR